MRRTLTRPMFRRGGQARQGYAEIGRVLPSAEDIEQYKATRPEASPDRTTSDFLINFGLDLISRSPQGNIFQTAAQAAKEPFDKFQTARAGQAAFDDKLALGAYDVVKGEQSAEKDFEKKKDLIKLEAELNPKLKKVFREEIPEVRINEYAGSLEENDFDFIKNNAREIASDIVTYNVFKEKNPDSSPAKKDFRGILPYEYDTKTGKPVPNYETITVGQVFYNPEDGLFYERVAEEGIIGTDFKALDPFTYD
jgi:hypothetical protein